ncbi:Casein kinase I isoform alpha [Orchesella cincta]|uniref:non-specific serine/threonine protein kinase n=1 Tax=Orchesella cincta TaxID=48709 RepID=A0A1D2N503_ORCCI|nr:Casein kinase I isoform alpha [Orchesella cincta]
MSSIKPVVQLEGQLVGNNNFKILKKIGCGGFGEVYSGQRLDRPGEVAIKTEPKDSKNPSLGWESKVYLLLGNGPGIPKGIWAGLSPLKTHQILIMELLGPSLQDVVGSVGKLKSKSVYSVGIQIMKSLEFIHEKGIIHQDIKPANMLIGVANSNKIYLSDFGLSKHFRDMKTGNHLPYECGKGFVGTSTFASVNAHLGRNLSRRDDLESLAFTLMYLLNGTLPWEKVSTSTKTNRLDIIKDMKNKNINCPDFGNVLQHSRKLKFEETPDYHNISNFMEMEFKYINAGDENKQFQRFKPN